MAKSRPVLCLSAIDYKELTMPLDILIQPDIDVKVEIDKMKKFMQKKPEYGLGRISDANRVAA